MIYIINLMIFNQCRQTAKLKSPPNVLHIRYINQLDTYLLSLLAITSIMIKMK